ncbi:hypothetical protein CYY_005277 [Polysphondylium violaceum]|uniref:Signal sequence receptor subunit alpha n=1 Tax=Polysphondylium violaceum TaxID=133409 RepID=A0A8J4PS08_9MYCE|nr:hypothetical protein CYY_005277 [Polysphondylium violaceum]
MYKYIALLLSVLLILNSVYSEEVTVTEDLENTVGQEVPSDVSFSYIFPDYQDKHFPAGSVIEVLVGFSNNGQETKNITHIFASLNHPQDFSYYIQNYTRGEFGIAVKPGHHATLAYRFVPNELLDPRQFGLLISMDYQDSIQNYTHTFFNSTINITEKDSTFDLEQFFLIIFGLGIIGLVGFLVYNRMPKSKKSSRSSKGAQVVFNEDDQSEWLAGTSADSPKVTPKSPKTSKPKTK